MIALRSVLCPSRQSNTQKVSFVGDIIPYNLAKNISHIIPLVLYQEDVLKLERSSTRRNLEKLPTTKIGPIAAVDSKCFLHDISFFFETEGSKEKKKKLRSKSKVNHPSPCRRSHEHHYEHPVHPVHHD